MPARMEGGGNVKVVVRVRAFLKRGEYTEATVSSFCLLSIEPMYLTSLQNLNARQNA